MNPKEEPDKLKEKDTPPKATEGKGVVLDTTKLGFSRSALVSSLPKLNLPVFDGQTGTECSKHWYMTNNFPKHRRWFTLKHQ